MFIIVNMARMPRCGSPTSQPVASSKFMTQVDDALMPILCSMPLHCTPLRGPTLLSSLGQELGHQEQADALDALGRVGQAREHEVQDVFRQIMLAGADEDLGAGDG